MQMALTGQLKHNLGAATNALLPQCNYSRCIFLIGHMRCGSTALSNILCSRPDISGYGETHISYTDKNGPGALVLNQLKRSAWKPQADYLFDKILHNVLDSKPPEEFFKSCAIFLIRDPKAAIPSILNLSQKTGMREYATFKDAESYYTDRLLHIKTLWKRFPSDKRCGFTHDALTQDTKTVLNTISQFLGLESPLRNYYAPSRATKQHGTGDPLNAHKHDAIVEGGIKKARNQNTVSEGQEIADRTEELWLETATLFQRDKER